MATEPMPMAAERRAEIREWVHQSPSSDDAPRLRLVAQAATGRIMASELLAEIDRLRGGGWVKTAERLPESGADCWWWTKDDDCWRGSFEGDYVSTGGEFGDFPLETFTHWQPVRLPGPPMEVVNV